MLANSPPWCVFGAVISAYNPLLTVVPSDKAIRQFTGGSNTERPSASLLMRYFHRPPEALFDGQTYIDYFQNFLLYGHTPGTLLKENDYLEVPIPGGIQHKVRPRQKGVKVARIQIVSPTAGEVFYLQSLLNKRPARSFEELRTIDGILYSSFNEAALRFGLFSDQNEGHYALSEAISCFCTPAQLRFLFARIVLEGYPAVPLWDEFGLPLAQDLTGTLMAGGPERAKNLALERISSYLSDASRSLSDFGLPEPVLQTPEVIMELCRYEHRRGELHQGAMSCIQSMTPEQSTIFSTIQDHFALGETDPPEVCNPIFLEGRPGRGKTFLLKALAAHIRGSGRIVLIVASSALAATLYEGGRTAHNLFRIPITEAGMHH